VIYRRREEQKEFLTGFTGSSGFLKNKRQKT
jgi:hypothetical protein